MKEVMHSAFIAPGMIATDCFGNTHSIIAVGKNWEAVKGYGGIVLPESPEPIDYSKVTARWIVVQSEPTCKNPSGLILFVYGQGAWCEESPENVIVKLKERIEQLSKDRIQLVKALRRSEEKNKELNLVVYGNDCLSLVRRN